MKKILLFMLVGIFMISFIAANPTFIEKYEEASNNGDSVYGINWKAQYITVGTTGDNTPSTVDIITLRLLETGAAPTYQISLTGVDGSNKPNMDDIKVWALFKGSDVGAGEEWFNVTMNSTEFAVLPDTKYTIVINSSGGDNANKVTWRHRETTPTYAGGNRWSSGDSGSSWADDGRDFLFQVWGNTTLVFTFNAPTPTSGSSVLSGVQTINITASASPNQLRNISLWINGTLNETVVTTDLINTSLFLKNFSPGLWSYFINTCTDQSFCFNSSERFLTASDTVLNSRTYNTSTGETANERFSINLSSLFTITSARLVYAGAEYALKLSNLAGAVWNLSTSIDIPIGVTNNTFNFSVTTTNGTSTLGEAGQEVNETIFTTCNTTWKTKYLNVTFKDEGTGNSINASVPSSTWKYYLGLGTVTKTLSFSTNNINQSYEFCGSPNRTFYVDPLLQYAQGILYPQRVWNPPLTTYTNILTTQILYLLSTLDGIFTTYQVVNPSNQPISGVSVTSIRTVGGTNITIGTGTTGDDGAITFWNNPDFLHYLNFSKPGFSDVQLIHFPTQTSYTVNMGSSAEVVPDYFQGIKYSIEPLNDSLLNDTTYRFEYNVTSSFWDLQQYGYHLRLANGSLATTQTSTTAGTPLPYNFNTTNQSIVYMDYWWRINDTYVNSSRYWGIYNTEGSAWSIRVFFNDLTRFMNSGLFGLDNFGRYFIIFMILTLSVGIMSLKFGIRSPMAITSLIFAIIFFFDVVVGIVPPIRDVKYILTIISGIAVVLAMIRGAIR